MLMQHIVYVGDIQGEGQYLSYNLLDSHRTDIRTLMELRAKFVKHLVRPGGKGDVRQGVKSDIQLGNKQDVP
jgi:hypothetical protein